MDASYSLRVVTYAPGGTASYSIDTNTPDWAPGSFNAHAAGIPGSGGVDLTKLMWDDSSDTSGYVWLARSNVACYPRPIPLAGTALRWDADGSTNADFFFQRNDTYDDPYTYDYAPLFVIIERRARVTRKRDGSGHVTAAQRFRILRGPSCRWAQRPASIFSNSGGNTTVLFSVPGGDSAIVAGERK